MLALASPDSDKAAVLTLLEAEATRVIEEHGAAKTARAKTHAVGPLPHKERIAACIAFMSMSSADRQKLVERMLIVHGNFNATGLQMEVEIRLRSYPKRIRPQVAQRLLEWWDLRVGRSLIGNAPRQIAKDELLDRLQAVVISLGEDDLPDDFSNLLPTDPTSGLGTRMQQQIELVSGGPSRISRAATARWRAREQRNRWMLERIGLAAELNAWDQRIIEAWKDRHGPMCDDCKNKTDEERSAHGLTVSSKSGWRAVVRVRQPILGAGDPASEPVPQTQPEGRSLAVRRVFQRAPSLWLFSSGSAWDIIGQHHRFTGWPVSV